MINCKIKEKEIKAKLKESSIKCKIKDMMLYNVIESYMYGSENSDYSFIGIRRKEK